MTLLFILLKVSSSKLWAVDVFVSEDRCAFRCVCACVVRLFVVQRCAFCLLQQIGRRCLLFCLQRDFSFFYCRRCEAVICCRSVLAMVSISMQSRIMRHEMCFFPRRCGDVFIVFLPSRDRCKEWNFHRRQNETILG